MRVAKAGFSDRTSSVDITFNRETQRATLIFSRPLVSFKAYTPLRMAALLEHQLLHILMRHNTMMEPGRINDIAQDTIINALIVRLTPSFQQLLNDCYDKNLFPQMFLRPLANLKRIEHDEIREHVRAIYKSLYRKPSRWELQQWAAGVDDPAVVTVEDVANSLHYISAIQKAHQEKNKKNGEPTMKGLGGLMEDWWDENTEFLLLGNHNPDPAIEGLLEEMEDFESLVAELKAEIGCNPNAKGLFKYAFALDKDAAPEELMEAMSASLREDVLRCKQIVEKVIGPAPNDSTVVPVNIGRREIFLLAMGHMPTFYPAFGAHDKPQGDVKVYIDVSGSMGDQAPFLVMLLINFKERIDTEFYEFSTEIAAIPFHDFLEKFEKTGEVTVSTTGGTSFDPIFAHAKEHDYRKILIITDGMAGVTEEMSEFAREIETYVVFTNNHQSEPLTGIAKDTWVMPELTKPKINTKEKR